MYAGGVGGQGPGVDDNRKQSPMSSSFYLPGHVLTPECIHVFTWLFTRISLALASAALPLCSPSSRAGRRYIFLTSHSADHTGHRATCAKMSPGRVVQQPTAGSLLIVSPSQSLSCLCSPSHRSLEGALKHCDLQSTSRSPQAPGKPQVRLTLCSRLQPWSGDADAVLRECPHGAHRHRSPCPHTCSIMHHPLLTSDGFSGV
ncbi:hypothetical protein V8E36_004544 [Tilletia maclaganii]